MIKLIVAKEIYHKKQKEENIKRTREPNTDRLPKKA